MIELNKIYNVNCLDLMRKLPDNYFDLILTDPPYGMSIHKKNMGKNGGMYAKPKEYEPYDWDESIPSKEIFTEMLRVSKNQIIFGGNFMTEYLPPSRCWIIWDKDNGETDYADCELAWTSFDSPIRKFKFKWMGMLQENMKWKDKRVHPTQKPVALGRWILKKFGQPGLKVFDPFAGSGSFLVAIKQSNCVFVGCDINSNYCKLAEERLKQEVLL